MAEIVARGVRLHVQLLTARDTTHRLAHPVVFIHGLGMDNLSSFYYTLANPVAYLGATVILYDLRGHGYPSALVPVTALGTRSPTSPPSSPSWGSTARSI
jgi:pimeloyl-ACP methyl ester carboxylesterase